MTWLLPLFRQNRIVFIWGGLLVLTTGLQVFVANPHMNPYATGLFNTAQLQLQFAFTPEQGVAVLESWGGDARSRYLDVIWIDFMFALSYGPFFYMLISRLGGGPFWSILPLVEVGTNFLETTLEIYWVVNHGPDNMMPLLFFIHSIVASIKWLVLVPVYIVHSGVLVWAAWRDREQWMERLVPGQ